MLRLASTLLLSTVLASPAAPNNAYCAAVRQAVSLVRQDAIVTSYCAAVLGVRISTSTSTITSTTTPVTITTYMTTTGTTTLTAATSTTTIVDTSTAPEVLSIATSTVYETTRITTETITSPLTGCSTSPPLAYNKKKQRDVARAAPKLPSALSPWAKQITSACKCLDYVITKVVTTTSAAAPSTSTLTVPTLATSVSTPITSTTSFITTVTPTRTSTTTLTIQTSAVISFTGPLNIIPAADESTASPARHYLTNNLFASPSTEFVNGEVDPTTAPLLFVLASDGTLYSTNGNTPATGPITSGRTYIGFQPLDASRTKLLCSITKGGGTCPLNCAINGYSLSFIDGGDWYFASEYEGVYLEPVDVNVPPS